MVEHKSLIARALFGIGTVAAAGTLAVTTGVLADSPKPVGDKAPVTKTDCRNGGFSTFGFKNQGQCIKYVVQADKSNGYGGNTTANAQEAADAFGVDVTTLGAGFRTSVDKIIADAANASTSKSLASFKSKFGSANTAYDASIASALATFKSQVEDAKSTATSKDQFIDRFNHAKADYLNKLEAAKNKLAGDLSGLGGNDVVKDAFMNRYNAVKDAYSNQLEDVKNTFAATIG